MTSWLGGLLQLYETHVSLELGDVYRMNSAGLILTLFQFRITNKGKFYVEQWQVV